jgi:hypothetical protein
MLVVPVVEGLEYMLEVGVLLDCNSLQLIIASNGYTKVVADRAKIYYLKLAAELLFKGVDGSFTADDFDIVYIN